MTMMTSALLAAVCAAFVTLGCFTLVLLIIKIVIDIVTKNRWL